MSGFLHCAFYLAATGIAAFFLGRILPKSWFRYQEAPYKAYPFEKNGKIYEALGIRKWKDKLPDMSRILPWFIPSKRLPKTMTAAQVELMLQETCVAEFIHALLCITGLRCLSLWNGAGGRTLYALYLLGNIPFSLIQRYNRPKLARIAERLNTKEKGTAQGKCCPVELQYQART